MGPVDRAQGPFVTTTRILLSFVVLAGASACELHARTVGFEPIEMIEPGIDRRLTVTGSCGDLGMYAMDPGESVALFIAFPEAIAAADHSTARVLDDFDPADLETRLRLMRAENPLNDPCNLEPWEATVYFEAWYPVKDESQEGIVELTIDPGDTGDRIGTASATLTDVTLLHTDDDGNEQRLVIESLVIPPVLSGEPLQ
jgi:hypothetical protein